MAAAPAGLPAARFECGAATRRTGLPLPRSPLLSLPPPQAMLWETSLLDPEEGIRFRGYSIPQLQVREVAGSRPALQLLAHPRCGPSPGWACLLQSLKSLLGRALLLLLLSQGSAAACLAWHRSTALRTLSCAGAALSPQEKLPGAKPGGEPLPEGMLWLLLTGEASCCSCCHVGTLSAPSSM